MEPVTNRDASGATRPDSPLIAFDNVTKRYGNGGIVLDGIDLRVDEGEFIGLIGPSGCGKSTLLKLISGLAPVTAGNLVVDGMKPTDARAELAIVFQDPTLLPWLTVRGNIELPMKLKGIDAPARRQVSDRLLEVVRLGHVADNYPRQLSGGMRMRTSIARALSLSPRIMLLDEPFGALDEMTRDRLNEDLLKIRDEARWTAFFVTHSVSEAVFLSNRIVVLSAYPGRVRRIVDVPFDYPRGPALRDSIEFHNTVCEISHELRNVQL